MLRALRASADFPHSAPMASDGKSGRYSREKCPTGRSRYQPTAGVDEGSLRQSIVCPCNSSSTEKISVKPASELTHYAVSKEARRAWVFPQPLRKKGPRACWRPKSREETPTEGTAFIVSDPDRCLRDIVAVSTFLRESAGPRY